MAKFLKGKYKAFYSSAQSECVKDTFRFTQTKPNEVVCSLTRKDADSFLVEKYLKNLECKVRFIPLSEEDPQQGGKVQVNVKGMDWVTFTP